MTIGRVKWIERSLGHYQTEWEGKTYSLFVDLWSKDTLYTLYCADHVWSVSYKCRESKSPQEWAENLIIGPLHSLALKLSVLVGQQ